MPLFEYECGKCGDHFEELVHGDAKPVCPGCGSKKTKKLLSTFAAHAGGADVPPCRRDGPGCDFGKCGSGRCGIE